ncbi:hypothetical protein NPIL_656801 [Nephila pilipes]|uniref:Uncharacterized protein n=1 Tax=Nephila pilipes TaxID=299642 RepID=A0A8X6PHV7_NEPPI|nr:hypothetical protein NPIL_656801 [Nephila pilipes]
MMQRSIDKRHVQVEASLGRSGNNRRGMSQYLDAEERRKRLLFLGEPDDAQTNPDHPSTTTNILSLPADLLKKA